LSQNLKLNIMKNFRNTHGYNMINEIVNCNSIKMVNGSKWINWYLNQKKRIPQKNLDRMVYHLNNYVSRIK
jgi:hypothetical protein